MTRRLPLMLVHGFNGVPGVWTDSGFRQHLIAQGDLDPELVRVFSYGAAPDGTYDNRGDLRSTASRLAGARLTREEAMSCSVDRLSADSVARGGPARVTLIGHSLGGIIASYYLSCGKPDVFGTVYRGNVERVIAIGAPYLGIDLLHLTGLTPVGSASWQLIRMLEGLHLTAVAPARVVREWDDVMGRLQTQARTELLAEVAGGRDSALLVDSPVLEQIAPDSPLLASLRAPGGIPNGVACHSLYGDIRVCMRVSWGGGGPVLLGRDVSFGDLIVTARSAAYVMGSAGKAQGFVTERRVEVMLRQRDQGANARSLWQQMPETSHARLLANRAVQAAVFALIASSY